MIRTVVIGPSALDRACLVAALAEADGVGAEACADAAGHDGPSPDMVLLQDQDASQGSAWLAQHLRAVAASWPGVPVMVLTGRDGVAVCLAAGVRACLSPRAGRDRIVAAIHLVCGDMAVYPAELVIAVAGQERRAQGTFGHPDAAFPRG